MSATKNRHRAHCTLREQTAPVLPPDLTPGRARAIRLIRAKWVKGTVLHYHFLDGPSAQHQAVRDAFGEWKQLGIGLDFVEVSDPSEAEVRVAFADDGSWSYVGKDVLGIDSTQPTMNFGWDLTDDYGRTTALHEIGHTIGLPHEHQNPFAGIVWDEPAVYTYFAGAPNNWPQDQTFHNVLRKLHPSEVEGSRWDPNSVMEYWFPPGLIKEPAKYASGLDPAGGLSAADKKWAKLWYPALKPTTPALTPFVSARLSLKAGQQVDYAIEPDASRSYVFSTFGTADTVMVLFEEVNGELRYVTGDDDSGTDRNAQFTAKMFQGRKYVVRLRLYWVGKSGNTAIITGDRAHPFDPEPSCGTSTVHGLRNQSTRSRPPTGSARYASYTCREQPSGPQVTTTGAPSTAGYRPAGTSFQGLTQLQVRFGGPRPGRDLSWEDRREFLAVPCRPDRGTDPRLSAP